MKSNPLFVEDLSVQGMLHAAVVRSPIAAGRLLGVDVPKIPPAYTVIRAADIPGKNRLDGFADDVPVLAADRVSYIGEPVALIVGPDRARLEQYVTEFVLRLDEEKPQFGCDKFSSDRLAAKRTITIGDPDEGFRTAAAVLEADYHTSAQEHWYPEPHGALAEFSYDKLTVTLATQWPYQVRRTVSAVLAVNPEDVVVRTTDIGIHLDGKLWYPSLVAAHAALGALICKKPVKLVLTREEDFRFSPKRRAVSVRLRSAVDADGELLALETRSILDVGANAPFATEMVDRLCIGSLGAYRCPNVRIEGYAVRTNTPPAGPFSGLGLSPSLFAMERQASRIADALRVDPLEWRRDHALNRNDHLVSGTLIKDLVPAAELLDSVATMSDYRRKWASYELLRRADAGSDSLPRNTVRRGIGITFAYQGNGFISAGADKGTYSVDVTLEKNGTLEIRTSAVASSEETSALWRRLAAELLAMDDDAVRLAVNRTDVVPDSGPSSLSRNVTIIPKLIERACAAIRKQRFRDPLPITVNRTYRAPRTAAWDAGFNEGGTLAQIGWGAAVVEVEIDPEDYVPRTRGVWLVVDGGRILSERKARSALKTTVGHALSWASREKVEYSGGSLSALDAFSYDIPPLRDVPPITIDFFWTETSGPKGIGELPFACVPAAYVQAVSQAADHPFGRLPVDAALVRTALQRAGETP